VENSNGSDGEQGHVNSHVEASAGHLLVHSPGVGLKHEQPTTHISNKLIPPKHCNSDQVLTWNFCCWAWMVLGPARVAKGDVS